ncbi:dnaJ homolog subfamily C member 12-like [Branchiostoma floridae]|uniref:DnaJ homolog subfamily C member 12-like n=1 Tax=Branchiostoma floridae TaxID=7739 RepID=A0A9J7MIR9_BRAFL|nr:dnaJ homolog subfamily C member 12-like [Branchiostoma floridae]
MDSIFSYQRDEDEDFYKILGCDEQSTTEQINQEFKLKALDCHPDKKPDDPEAAERYQRLQQARDVLVNEESRSKYDHWRRSGIAMPYKQWVSMGKSVHTSMHWAMRTKKDPMLDNKPHSDQSEGGEDGGINNSKPLSQSKESERAAADSPEHPSPSKRLRVFAESSHSGQSSTIAWSRGGSWSTQSPNETLRKFRNYEI